MGVIGRAPRQTTREAFAAEALAQEARRPATRPRAPPLADDKHTAPLWSQHLQTYVSYSWREREWKRWSTTAKIWKPVPDIDAVVRAESKIHMEDGRWRGWEWSAPLQPVPAGYGEPLWYQAERLWVCYNSTSGNWMEWYDGLWMRTRTADWPEMPVMKKVVGKHDSSSSDSAEANLEKSQSIASSGGSSASEAVAKQNQKSADCPAIVVDDIPKSRGKAKLLFGWFG